MTPIDDDELRAMIEARGERHAIDLRAVAARARQDAHAAPRSRRRTAGFRAALAGLGSVAAVALVLLLVVVPLSLRPTASAVPSATAPPATAPAASGLVPSSPVEAGPVETLSAAELAAWLTTAGASAVGRVVLFEGELTRDSPLACFMDSPDCPPTVVGAAPYSIVVARGGETVPAPWDGSGPVAGTFALRATEGTWDGKASVMEYLGRVKPVEPANPRACGASPDCHGGLAWPVGDLARTGPAESPDLYLVAGWMVRTSSHPCPSPAALYHCPTSDLLTPERVQPTSPDGSSELPEIALHLPSGTYDEFAPEPAADGPGVVPRPGTFLLRRVAAECLPASSCDGRAGAPRWVVSARVDPLAATWSPTPFPSAAPDGERYPGGIPTSIEGEPVLIGLDAQARWRDALDDTPFLVGGWFDSKIVNICSGGIGPTDPNPLAARGCPRFDVVGIPGRPVYPDSVTMPAGDGPIVLRVHTRDPGAATCIAESIDECRRRVVVDAVTWFGDEATAAAPLGPREAISRATSVFVMEWRPEGENTQNAVDEDVFTIPLACPAPWPTLLFSIHGDPRYGLVAVFEDPVSRERFQVSNPPEIGDDCLTPAIERPAGPRWVGHENVLVLAFADDAFAARIASVLVGPQPDQAALPMTEPELDRSLETVTDYLLARAGGALDHAWGERLNDPIFEDPGGPRDVVADAYAAWTADVFRRHAADALIGRIESLDDEPTHARIGPKAVRVVQEAGVTRSRIFRVTYPDATDPALAVEEFLVVQMPESEFRDWQLIRISGAPYPPS